MLLKCAAVRRPGDISIHLLAMHMTQRASIAGEQGLGKRALLLGALILAGLAPAGRAQEAPAAPAKIDVGRQPLLPPEIVFGPPAASSNQNQADRIRLFRIQPGFLSDPPGLDQDDMHLPDPDGPDFLTLAIGNDNPFFDFRQPGDPGGVGFARFNTQLQLFDTSKTSCSLGLQAVTPAGPQFDGLPDRMGPTVLTPALSLFHALDEGTAIQAYVGKNMPIENSATQLVRRDLQYGLAVQRPLSMDENDFLRNVYVSVGALGLYRINGDARSGALWEMLPGLHYKVADNWWISTGVSLPFNATGQPGGQHWQVTCSLRF
jgi:hypothetical protein